MDVNGAWTAHRHLGRRTGTQCLGFRTEQSRAATTFKVVHWKAFITVKIKQTKKTKLTFLHVDDKCELKACFEPP